MTESLTIALAQINPVVGDIAGNVALVGQYRQQAARQDADLVVFPECVLSGYPPEDLVLKPAFQDHLESALVTLAELTDDGGPALLLGSPVRHHERLYNAALLLDGGARTATVLKRDLPNYGVFDELRLFQSGPMPEPMTFRGHRLGVMVCEDMWTAHGARHLAAQGAEILISLNASPFEQDKPGRRRALARDRVTETGLPLIYVNQVGGQDELVFDGHSFAYDHQGEMVLRLASFAEDLAILSWQIPSGAPWTCLSPPTLQPHPEGLAAIYLAMVLGLRDYVTKNHFPGVLIGLSGGIDSALSAAVAVDALGGERVRCVMMPSPYTSAESLEDATASADLLGVSLETISIEPAMTAFRTMTEAALAAAPASLHDTTPENIQARARGLTLMALSNRLGHMVLSTGNKSENSVGYATLYGDMCGGYSVLKDVYKTTVFALCRWRNETWLPGLLGPKGAVMPERVISKPPTAELKPNQTDQDTLPPYEELDRILEGLIEGEASWAQLIAQGHDGAIVKRVMDMVARAEYKRRQAPPGVKITSRAFGRDRRYPITNAFTDRL